jgi:hypothetical protein
LQGQKGREEDEGEESRNNSTISVFEICLSYHSCVMRGERDGGHPVSPHHELEAKLQRSSSKVVQEIATGAY